MCGELTPQVPAQPLHPAVDLQRGTRGPHRIIPVGHRCTKQRHHGVTNVFVHAAAQLLHHGVHHGGVAAHNAAQLFGIHSGGQRGEPAEVRKHDGHRPPFGVGGRNGRNAAVLRHHPRGLHQTFSVPHGLHAKLAQVRVRQRWQHRHVNMFPFKGRRVLLQPQASQPNTHVHGASPPGA